MNTRLRKAREKAKLTQLQMAKKAGIGHTSYQIIEHNRTTPSVRTAIRIAKVLGVKVEEIFDEDLEPFI